MATVPTLEKAYRAAAARSAAPAEERRALGGEKVIGPVEEGVSSGSTDVGDAVSMSGFTAPTQLMYVRCAACGFDMTYGDYVKYIAYKDARYKDILSDYK